MTNQEHPITPAPALVRQWIYDAFGPDYEQYIATQAAQWGADQELEACINYFHEYDPSWGENSELITGLRAARRPKPPSLKEQALEAARRFYANGHEGCSDEELTDDFHTIRRALEQLND